jgi:sec-independent protein translocase protein TatA
MFGMGPWELALVFLVILLLFGAKRLPDIAQGLGKGIREFKKAMRDTQEEEGIKDFKKAIRDTKDDLKSTLENSDKPTRNSDNKND